MRRMMVVLAATAMMATSAVAQAAPISDKADAQCAKLARQTLGASFNPPNYNFHGGTEADNDFTGQATEGDDVFCGFGGVDRITTLDAGDIFLAGAGSDLQVQDNNGTFYGGEGDDGVNTNSLTGTFDGGPGDDTVGTGNPPVDGSP
jgi:hypothetical protein